MYDTEAEKLNLKNGLEQLRWDLENKFGFSEILIEEILVSMSRRRAGTASLTCAYKCHNRISIPSRQAGTTGLARLTLVEPMMSPAPRISHRNTEDTEKNNIILCILCFSG